MKGHIPEVWPPKLTPEDTFHPTFRHRALTAEARVRELEAWLKLAEIERTGEIPFHAKHSGKARSTAIVAKRKEKS